MDQCKEIGIARRGVRGTVKCLLLALAVAGASSGIAQTVPVDPEIGCSVSATKVNGWFKSGTATLDGPVNPANSVAFPNLPNCSFYEWSYQMFLWLTSPTPAIYGGGGGQIFNSASFFDISPEDANHERTFLPNRTGLPKSFGVLSRQVGPNRLPIVFDKQGRQFEIERPSKAPPRIQNKAGELIEISHVKEDAGKRIFLDRGGKLVEPHLLEVPKLRERELPGGAPRVSKFLVDRIPVFLDSLGNVIEIEQGQADGSVLIAQNGSPIYYGLHANDLFAYFRTMQGPAVPAGVLFPTRQEDLDTITTFAAAHGKTFVDAEALAIEVKTSWIEAAGIPNLSEYITVNATIPTYDKSDPNRWVPNGQKSAQLAMVGMHVVGSTKGHPEMIWATFEHLGNAPNAAYTYRNSGGGTTSVAQNTAGNWLFCANNSAGQFSQARNLLDGVNIIAASSTPVGPDNVIRWKPWGAAANLSPNFKTPEASNSEIISINNSVRGVLVAGDVRRNYIMTGSTWMIAGTFPFTSFNPTQVGTSMLNNATMESFSQGTSNQAAFTSNCFSCHGGPTANAKTTNVSHIFNVTKPLFP